eukprot:Tbor_TRINITY_DN3313_c0_g1::TRINITY_DN3313_c0_g1_i2::g.23466::m.23466
MDPVSKEIRSVEEEINTTSSQMGQLKAEYTFNRNSVNHLYMPRTLPHTTAIYQSKVYQKELELRIQWLEAKIHIMETKKEIGTRFIEQRDMKTVHHTLFLALVPVFEEAFTEMEGITKDELAILRSYVNPPDVVLDTVRMVMLLRGEKDPTWESSKVIFTETYFYSFFISKARNHHKHYASSDSAIGNIDQEYVDDLKKYIMTPENHPDEVSQISRPCGIFARWIFAVYSHYLLSLITQPVPSGIEETKEELEKCRDELQQKKDEVASAEATNINLQIEQQERLEELRVRYDDVLLPLQDMFFDANKRFEEVYSSPRKERERSSDPVVLQ